MSSSQNNAMQMIEYQKISKQRSKRPLLTPNTSNKLLVKEQQKLTKQITEFVQGQSQKQQNKSNFSIQPPKILKLDKIMPKNLCVKKQISLNNTQDQKFDKTRRNSKSKKKLDLSLNKKRQKSKTQKSGIKLCPNNQSLRKIQTFKLIDLEQRQINDGLTKIKTPNTNYYNFTNIAKKKQKLQIKRQPIKKKIKLSKLRS